MPFFRPQAAALLLTTITALACREPEARDDPGGRLAPVAICPGDPGCPPIERKDASIGTMVEPDATVAPLPAPDAGQPTCAPLNKVDMLFMIDNSASMSQEQNKLATVLPGLVRALATGNRSGMPSPKGTASDFPPVASLHIGVVTSDLGVNGAPAQNSCGNRSFEPTERDPRSATVRVDKPVGDDGVLQIDTVVATAGIFAPPLEGGPVAEVVPPDPGCANIAFPDPQRFVDYTAGDDVESAVRSFSCIAKRGRNGCGLEQQLEATLKALTPADSPLTFTALSPRGHGGSQQATSPAGKNRGFLRDDALLVVFLLTDEEDCSVPDQNAFIFDAASSRAPGGVNVRCGLSQNQPLLHPPARYIDGLKALKPGASSSQIIFAALTGVPLAAVAGDAVHSGPAALDTLLARPDMQFAARRNASGTDEEPVPTCESPRKDGNAAPGRRYLEVAKGFGDDGLVSSICEDQYAPLFEALTMKIAARLKDTRCTR